MSEVTRILQRIEVGDAQASAELLPLVYDELRLLAARELRRGVPGNTLQPTSLVHEAYLRLVDRDDEPRWSHRGHFFAAAAQAMRRILVENARRKKSLKRGGGRERIPLAEDEIAPPETHDNLIALDEALGRLAESRPELAELVTLRYFGGLTMDEAASTMGISARTAARNWSFARAWLFKAISDPDSD